MKNEEHSTEFTIRSIQTPNKDHQAKKSKLKFVVKMFSFTCKFLNRFS